MEDKRQSRKSVWDPGDTGLCNPCQELRPFLMPWEASTGCQLCSVGDGLVGDKSGSRRML